MTPSISQCVTPRSHHAAGRAPKYKHIQKRPLHQRGSINHSTITIMFGIIAVIIVGLLGFFYLQQVVDTASQGTDIRALENKIIEIKEKQRVLELEGAQLRSIQAVEEKMNTLNLVATDKVTYLAPTQDRTVAVYE